MKTGFRALLFGVACLFLSTPPLQAEELPRIQMVNGTGQLIVNGHPFLILGGELGNSSSATAAQADAIIPKLATLHLNTILMPAAWEQLEPKEGNFDFRILDHWIQIARANKIHLVLLSFARDPDADASVAGIESVEEVSRPSGQWKTERPLNGDQTNQGRQLLMDAKRPHIYRVRLYSIPSERGH